MSYAQISNLFRSIQRLAFSTGQTFSKSPEEKEALRKIKDLFQTAHRLMYTSTNYGITENTAASFKETLEQKLDSVAAYIRAQDYNPYEDNLYVLAEKELPAVYSALGQYSPSSMPAQKPTQTMELPGMEITPDNVLDMPEMTVTPGEDVGAGKEKKQEDGGYYMGPVPNLGPAQLAPPVKLPRSEPYPAPGDDLPPAKSSHYNLDVLVNFANKYAQQAKDYEYGMTKDEAGNRVVEIRLAPGTSEQRRAEIKKEIESRLGNLYPVKFK